MQGGRPGAHVINEWPGNALKVVSAEKLKVNQWNHLFITYNGTGKSGGVKIYLNGKNHKKNIEADSLTKTIRTNKPLRIGRRFNSSFVNGAEIDEVRFYKRDLTAKEIQILATIDPIAPILNIPEANRTQSQTEILLTHFLETMDESYKINDQKAKAPQALETLQKAKLTSMVMGDNPDNKRRKTYLLMRGQYASPDKSKEILPDTPAFLPPMKRNFPKSIGLARWLVDRSTLTSRVTVNRHWQTLFGNALVSTPGDLGSQGSWPTHPDLLSWLAADFVENGWGVKQIKQMVMSSTYRQSSVARSVHLEQDPEASPGPPFPTYGRIRSRQRLCRRIT